MLLELNDLARFLIASAWRTCHVREDVFAEVVKKQINYKRRYCPILVSYITISNTNK